MPFDAHASSAPPTVLPPTHPGPVAIDWMRDPGGNDGHGTLGDIADVAVTLPASTRAIDIDEAFRRDDTLRCLVLECASGPVLVDRSWFEAAITGPLGFGRLLHARRPVVEMVTQPTLVLGHDAPLAVAAASVVARDAPGTIANAVVVEQPDGFGVAHVSTIFERLAQHYAYQSLHDPLTRLPNRLYLMEQIRHPARDNHRAVLFSIDLDRFKDINDQLGHAAGDQVLAQFADRLRATSRASDVVARLGGDEFVLLAGSPLSGTESTALAERLVHAAARPFTVEVQDRDGATTRHVVTIGASVGIAHDEPELSGVAAVPLAALLGRADLAMYRAKEHGRGRAAHYDPAMRSGLGSDEQTRARREMERRLRAAIENGALELHYQPVVELPSGRVTGVEALARWHDPVLGQVPPDQFIPLAETTGLIIDLGAWVLRTACTQAAAWAAAGANHGLAVNVSPVQLAQPAFLGDVLAALDDSGFPADRLCLEVTETAAIDDLPGTIRHLAELRRRGVQIALDDFGTGHSSLTMLRALPLTIVKIDRSFVERVARSAQDAVLVRLVIDTAHTLGLQVCAEGIEDADQAHQLVSMGCDAAQGWYFGRPEPVSVDAVATWSSPPPLEQLDIGAPPPVTLGAADELLLVTNPSGRITYASSTSTALLGTAPRALVGSHVEDLLVTGTEASTALQAEGRAVCQLRHLDGGDRWFDARTTALRDDAGHVIDVLSVCRDVSATIELERALADSEARYQGLVDAHAASASCPVGRR